MSKSKETWGDVAKASAANVEAPKKKRGRPKKGEQRRLPIADERDAVRIPAIHEIPRPMSPEAFRTAAADSARQHNKIKLLEKEIHDFANATRGRDDFGKEVPSRKVEIKTLKETSAKLDREIEAESHLIEAPCIEVHDVNRRTVIVYLDEAGDLGEKIKERPMTDDEHARALKSAPFDPPIAPPEGEAEHDEEPEA